MWWFQRFSCFVTTGFAAEKCVTDARTYSLRDGRTETDGLKVSELLQGGGGSPRHRCQTAAQSQTTEEEPSVKVLLELQRWRINTFSINRRQR